MPVKIGRPAASDRPHVVPTSSPDRRLVAASVAATTLGGGS
ncbi:hypothetical protein [Allorhodopirellula solitaria]|nr:hypothetical protein [Allorhodopirellula solitaria]